MQANRAASGALCHSPSQAWEPPMDAKGLKWELGPQWFLLPVRSDTAVGRWQFVRGLWYPWAPH